MSPTTQLRPYQQQAVQALVTALAGGGTSQLRMACGTGKSLTAQRAAEALLQPTQGGVAAVLAPSLALVKQFLDGWRKNAAIPMAQAVAVCSDRTVGMSEDATTVADLDAEVTTDPEAAARVLRTADPSRLLLVVGTYASAAVLAEAVRSAGRPLDVLICDEAHRLAGNPAKHLRQFVTEPEWLPARRRIYMTATPRLYTDRVVRRGALSMDDEAFGPVAFEYAFPQAIADGHLDDYRALVTVVEDAEVRKVLESLADVGLERGEARNTVVAQVALLRAWQEQGVGRAIAFCDSIQGSKALVAQLPKVAAVMGYDSQLVRALHVDGSMNSQERAPILAKLAAAPDRRLVVVSNARCLGEGVDVPSVDAVLFACPKRSEIDIIQAAGRALRHGPGGRGIAKFILPMMLPEAPGDDLGQCILDDSAYGPTWTVIRALRGLDGALGAELDQLRGSKPTERVAEEADASQRRALPDRIVVTGSGADPKILQHITVALIGHTTAAWLDGYAALKEFHDAHGYFDPPQGVMVTDGYSLRAWVGRQRLHYRKGCLLPEHLTMLEALGFDWDPASSTWWHMFRRLLEGRDRSQGVVNPGGMETWVTDQRNAYAIGNLRADRVAALNSIGFEWESERVLRQRATVAAVGAWLAEHRDQVIPGDAFVSVRGMEVKVSQWLSEACDLRRSGELESEEEATLTKAGFDWVPPWWRRELNIIASFHVIHGHLRFPPDFDPPVREGVYSPPASVWLAIQQGEANRGNLAPECAVALNELDVSWHPEDDRRDRQGAVCDWMEMAELAVAYRKEHGHLRVPLSYTAARDRTYPAYLGCWLQVQRERKRRGRLTGASVALLDALGIDWSIRWPEADGGSASRRLAA